MGQDFGGRYVYACTVAAARRRRCTERCMCVPQWLSNHRLMRRGVRCRCFHCQMMLHDCLGLPLVWHGAVECRRKKMLAVLVLVGRPSKATTKHTPNWLPVVNSACLLGAVAALGRFYCSAFKDELTRRALLTFTYTLTYTPIEAHHAQCSVTIYQSS